jgi:molecular chaperone GrpE
MSNKKNTAPVGEETTSSEALDLRAEEIEKLEAEVLELKKELEETKSELDSTNDKYLRVAAEYDNFRRRSAKERDSIYSGAYADVIKQLLPIIDNIERAGSYSEAEKVAEGVKLICKSFGEVMNGLGITEIEAEGKEFDPNVHNAVFHVEDEAYGENTVVEVLQKGYKLGDTVIRYAMVKVAN